VRDGRHTSWRRRATQTGLAPWEFEFPFPGSLTSTFLQAHKLEAQSDAETLQQALAVLQKVVLYLFFFTLVTGPRSLSLELSDTRVYGPQTLAVLQKVSLCFSLFALADLERSGFFPCKVDGLVPHTQQVDLGIVFDAETLEQALAVLQKVVPT